MKLIVALFLLGCVSSSFGQADSVSAFSNSDTVHSVRKAVIFSAVLPGAGQVYNHIAMPKGKKKAFWKVPLIYAGLGATGYFLLQNNAQQKSLKNEYNLRSASNFTQTFDPNWNQYDDEGILQLFALKQNRRDLFIIAFGVVYLVQVLDAAVEAHFVSFEVSENLALNISPTMLTMQNPGVRLSLKLH